MSSKMYQTLLDLACAFSIVYRTRAPLNFAILGLCAHILEKILRFMYAKDLMLMGPKLTKMVWVDY